MILVRHPETADPRVIAGQSEVGLSADGEAALDAIVTAVPRATRVVASDLGRCRALAEVLAGRNGVPLELDPRWREQSFGSWEGRRWDEVDGRTYLDAWTTASPPGGERIGEVLARVATAMRALGDDTLVVTHAGPIRCALVAARGLTLEEAFAIPVPFGSWRSV
jgi:alpha-ribazole phosphatase